MKHISTIKSSGVEGGNDDNNEQLSKPSQKIRFEIMWVCASTLQMVLWTSCEVGLTCEEDER
jgi:hypothetical protein